MLPVHNQATAETESEPCFQAIDLPTTACKHTCTAATHPPTHPPIKAVDKLQLHLRLRQLRRPHSHSRVPVTRRPHPALALPVLDLAGVSCRLACLVGALLHLPGSHHEVAGGSEQHGLYEHLRHITAMGAATRGSSRDGRGGPGYLLSTRHVSMCTAHAICDGS
jgi:hypothetical protein